MRGSTWLKLLAFLAVAVGMLWVLKLFGLDVTQLTPAQVRGFVLSFGIWAPLIYLAAYGQPLIPLPASVMTATAGLAFGTAWGVPAALTGATLRACGQFLVARLLGQDIVMKLLKGRMPTLYETTGKHSFKTVLLVRLIPNFPFDIQNYGLGFSQVRFAPYALATALGIVPGTVAYVYFGYSLSDPKQLWKMFSAMLLILGLVLLQRSWVARRRPASSGR